jgi:hypothetical protein
MKSKKGQQKSKEQFYCLSPSLYGKVNIFSTLKSNAKILIETVNNEVSNILEPSEIVDYNAFHKASLFK